MSVSPLGPQQPIAPLAGPIPGVVNPLVGLQPGRGDLFSGSPELLAGNALASQMGVGFPQSLGGSLMDGILTSSAVQLIQGLQSGQDVSQQAQQLLQEYQQIKAMGMTLSPQTEQLVQQALQAAGIGQQPGGPQGGAPLMGGPQDAAPLGGAPQGGAPLGGAPQGGAPVGGAPQGGAPVGGAPQGGPTGQAPQAGAPQGGAPEGVGGPQEVAAPPPVAQTPSAPVVAPTPAATPATPATDSTTPTVTSTEPPPATTSASLPANPRVDVAARQQMADYLAGFQPGQAITPPSHGDNVEVLKGFHQGANNNCTMLAVIQSQMAVEGPRTEMVRTENGVDLVQPGGQRYSLTDEQMQTVAGISGWTGKDAPYANILLAGAAQANNRNHNFDASAVQVANPRDPNSGKDLGSRYLNREASALLGVEYQENATPRAGELLTQTSCRPNPNGGTDYIHTANNANGQQAVNGQVVSVPTNQVATSTNRDAVCETGVVRTPRHRTGGPGGSRTRAERPNHSDRTSASPGAGSTRGTSSKGSSKPAPSKPARTSSTSKK